MKVSSQWWTCRYMYIEGLIYRWSWAYWMLTLSERESTIMITLITRSESVITSTSSSSKILFSELLSLTLILKLIDWGVPSLGIQIIISSSMQLWWLLYPRRMLAVLRILGPGLKILFHSGGDTKSATYWISRPEKIQASLGLFWKLVEVAALGRLMKK